ncbi:MAG: LLM class F420-dependent oxidoreductase, partial [Candidatus Rokuibacteriota bacterium]
VSAAAATTTLRVGTNVINNDLRHPVVLAREAATVDLLTDGRLELGLGAGYVRSEYDQAGLRFDRGSVRVERL